MTHKGWRVVKPQHNQKKQGMTCSAREGLNMLYLLNLGLEVDYTYLDVRYLYEVICCTILTHMNDFEVKVMDFEKKIMLSFFG